MTPQLPFHVVHISSLPPTKCGVGEYTAALAQHLKTARPCAIPFFIRLDQSILRVQQSHNCITVNPSDITVFDDAANAVNSLGRKVVLLQHEFKLYGGSKGQNLLRLLDRLEGTLISTLHTVWPAFPPEQTAIFRALLQRSEVLIVFSERAAQILWADYGTEKSKVRVIPHGVPEVSISACTESFGFPRRSINFITSGLLRPAKGIEDVFAALEIVKTSFTDFTYVVCGICHPGNPKAREYRQQLFDVVASRKLEDHVFFLDDFLEWPELVRLIQACDVGILAYNSPEQSSSGVLALMMSCGKPVITTTFQHAKAIVTERNGIVVPMGDISALAFAILEIAKDSARRAAMSQENYSLTRSWMWPEVARAHLKIIEEITC